MSAFGMGIATDIFGNSYVTGDLAAPPNATVIFGEGERNEMKLKPAEGDLYIAKYDRNGRFLWATQAGGNGGDLSLGIATDGRGDSYITGSFQRTATFGKGEPNETELTAAGTAGGEYDMYVAKYDRNGSLVWATQAGGLNGQRGYGIATDGRGDSYVIGNFYGTTTFGAGEPNETTLTSAGDSDIFVAKYGSRSEDARRQRRSRQRRVTVGNCRRSARATRWWMACY